MAPTFKVSLLDYGAGNVRSVRNAILANGYEIDDIVDPSQIDDAKAIIFPGVGSFGSAMEVLHKKKFMDPLKKYLSKRDRPFLGICLGMQTLFDSSDENEEIDSKESNNESKSIQGLGVIPGKIIKFDETKPGAPVPHIGWNGRVSHKESPVLKYIQKDDDVYFVHSYYAPICENNGDWVLTSTTYGGQRFISSIHNGCIVATQFHPEKSGATGLHVIKGFLEAVENGTLNKTSPIPSAHPLQDQKLLPSTQLTKRLVVALDVRTNDQGDLVVTKGDQYDVREKSETAEKGGVRNLGKPVRLAKRYYEEGADEIAFLNITSFRQGVIEDMPMLQVLQEASKTIFVPLTVGGGIRSYTDPQSGNTWSALEVAARYFRAGADKISIGSDAVHASEEYIRSGGKKTGQTSIEMISKVYGVQAVVVSIDPKRVYLPSKETPSGCNHVVVGPLDSNNAGPNGEQYCWYQCTVKGGRETRDICAVTVAKAVEQLGAGEIMLNCIDMDGRKTGYDLPLMNAVSDATTIPVIASSGAGIPEHFSEVFSKTGVQAALAAGMFHRREVEIEQVKEHLRNESVPSRKASSK